MTDPAVWSGSWVADRLGVRVRSVGGAGGLAVPDLVGLALRVNPRRPHLLVSRVLGKHVPAPPSVVLGAGRLLACAVAALLAGGTAGGPADGAALLAAALSGDRSAPARLRAWSATGAAATEPVDALVVGYAETATGLGHAVSDALGGDYLHSTRRSVPGVRAIGAFEEAHSHATGHLLLPEDPALFDGPRPLVLVDDELSTGATALDTIRAVQSFAPRERYVVAGLVDVRSDADRRRMDEFADRLGVRIDVVALAAGRIDLPTDTAARAGWLVAGIERSPKVTAVPTPHRRIRAAPPAVRWPAGVRDGGRHGFGPQHRPAFDAALREVAAALLPALPVAPGARLLVLGTEELMHLPARIAAELEARAEPAGAQVLFSSTSRSPAVPVDHPGYALRSALTFGSHDDPDDGPGPRYAYNVAPPADGTAFDAVVVVVDDRSRAWPVEGPRLPDRLADAVAGEVTVVTVPSHRPAAGVRPR